MQCACQPRGSSLVSDASDAVCIVFFAWLTTHLTTALRGEGDSGVHVSTIPTTRRADLQSGVTARLGEPLNGAVLVTPAPSRGCEEVAAGGAAMFDAVDVAGSTTCECGTGWCWGEEGVCCAAGSKE